MEAVGQDAKAYEALTGHSFQMGLKHYQQYHKARQDKAEGRLMEFWSKLGLEAGTIEQGSENVAQNVALQNGAADYSELQDSEKPMAQTPEIQGFLQNKKTSCYGKQNVQEIKNWAKLDLLQNDLSPLDSKELRNSLFEQLQGKLQGSTINDLFLSLFDQLDNDEKNALLETLTMRIRTTGENVQ